jgi:hypothetical protein
LRPGFTIECLAQESMAVSAEGEAVHVRYFDALREIGLPVR